VPGVWEGTAIRSISIGAGLIFGALAAYVPKPLLVTPPPTTAAIAAAPTRPESNAPELQADALEFVAVSVTRRPVPAVRIAKREPPPSPSSVRRLSADTLCVSPSAQRECQAAFAAALQSVRVEEPAAGAAEPLRFHKRAAWIRKLETIGKEGIPFMRVPRGPDNELVVGIDRNGVLGFSLQNTSDR
jgi:hypothetical protein